MENPEEVLQALDEFQKMRPSEIPRELEDYLCWVAKTGDPVYQWSLIKPLFREKLTRVMTDFYESCPSLELAPCPNVEQFNYDIMKCNLLELLESFANAPFTVQRICELLTSPRKEYNRVDKFMRAIEKNILVVSTKEPAARRSENGDGMVNGSFDEEPAVTQPSHEVEMESWVKDCTTGNPVATPTGDLESPVLDSILSVSAAAGKVTKIGPTADDVSRSDIVDAAIDSREIIDSSNLTLPAQNQDDAICVQNLSGNGAVEPTPIAPDVPEAVMNEDTSSQPSLDSETEDTESIVSRKLLQTTFRTKDFVKTDEKPVKLYGVDEDEDEEEEEDEEEDEEEEEPQQHQQHEEEEEEEEDDKKKKKKKKKRSRVEEASNVPANSIASSIRSSEDTMTIDESKVSSIECQESNVPTVQVTREKRPRTEDGVNDDSETIDENNRLSELHDSSPSKKSCSVISGFTDPSEDSFMVSSVAMKSTGDTTDENNALRETTTVSCEERLTSSESPKFEENEDATTKEDTGVSNEDRSGECGKNSRPIVEEPTGYEETNDGETSSKSPTSDVEKQEEEESGVTIEEAMDDETRINKSIIPDPIPIIEEPKDPEPPRQSDSESTTVITELLEVGKNQTEIIDILETSKPIDSTIVVVEESSLTGPMNEDIANVAQVAQVAQVTTGQDDITDTVQCTAEGETDEKIEPAESMEVDGEESLPAFHQDEPMEQEPPGDMVKS